MKKADVSVSVSPALQKLFLIVVAGGWLMQGAFLFHDFGHEHLGLGNLAFQMTLWGQPIVFFLVSLAFVWKAYGDWLRKLFLALLWAVIGVSLYTVISVLSENWYADYRTRHPLIGGSSYWQNFGYSWVVMLVSLAVYVAVLIALKKRRS